MRNRIEARLKPQRYAFAVGYFKKEGMTLSEGMKSLIIKLQNSLPDDKVAEYIKKGNEVITKREKNKSEGLKNKKNDGE